MDYPNNHELDNNYSWDDGQLRENEANNSSDNNEAWDNYNWRQDEAEVESYTWNDKEREYFDDFNWDNEKRYFDNFSWDENNRHVEEDDWDEDVENLDENIDDIDQDFEDINKEFDNINLPGHLLGSLLPKIIHDKRGIGEDALADIMNRLQRLQGEKLPEQSLRSPIHGIREICIKPIYHILRQLMELDANDIEIGTESQGTILESRIIGIEDYIVIVRNQFREIVIPIHQIVGIYSRRLPQVSVLLEPKGNREGDWDCCERPLREYCSKYTGQIYTVKTLARDEIFASIKGTITKIGDGILILDNTVAILICKIISIEKDSRNK